MSACLNQLVRGLVGDIDGFFNDKAEILRSLFVSRKQFENLIERDCDGNLSGPIMGHTFHTHDLDFMESFLKTFELGLDQLEDFMTKLNSIQGLLRLDECSILYFLRQILNGPWACAATDITNLLSGNLNILQSTNNAIGTLGNAVRSNISTTVYGLEPVNAAIDLYNHLPPKMQENIDNSVKTATNVFNRNMGSIFNDNTLPYIDKLPILRVNQEWQVGFTNFASGNLMLKDVTFFNTLRNISNDVIGQIQGALGIVGSRIWEFQKKVNRFYRGANSAFGLLGSVNRLLLSLERTEYTTTNKIIQRKCEQIQTDILGNPNTTDETFELTMNTGNGNYDIYSTGGQCGVRTNRPTTETPIDEPLTGIDIFDTCEEATNRGRELGCEGCHTHTAPDGRVYYMPCNSMQDYLGIIAGIKEPDCNVEEQCEAFVY